MEARETEEGRGGEDNEGGKSTDVGLERLCWCIVCQ
jgi:hypothetical protein